MHLVQQITSGAPVDPLVVGAAAGLVVTVVLHVIGRIRRLIRAATLFAALGVLGAGGGPPILHAFLTTWR